MVVRVATVAFEGIEARPVDCGSAAIGSPPRGASRNIKRVYQAPFSTDRLMIEFRRSSADLLLPPASEGSAEVAARVTAARQIQTKRYAALGLPHVSANAAAPGSIIEEAARPDVSGMALLRDASERLNLSARGFHRVLKLARTIADLDGAATVGRAHLAEALSYRINGGQELRAA